MKYLSLLFLFFIGCSSQKLSQTLHDFPIFEGMDCPEQLVDNESQLRTQAESQI